MIRSLALALGLLIASPHFISARAEAAQSVKVPGYYNWYIRKLVREDARKQGFYATLRRPSVRSQITFTSPTTARVSAQITHVGGLRPGRVKGASASFSVKLSNWGTRFQRQGEWEQVRY